MKRVGAIVFALVVAWLMVSSASGYLFTNEWQAHMAEMQWYGDWGAVIFFVMFFSLFVLGFLRSPRRREWRHLGVAEAYLVALFTEMFGVPLTIYLLSSVLGFQLGFSGLEGHLWANLLARTGVLPLELGVALVMALSSALITLGLALMAAGWWQLVRSKGELLTSGLYRFVRHPQYAGFLLLLVAFLLQWPTLITLAMFPVMVVMYRRLARREEAEMAGCFGEDWLAYASRTPMFVPGWRAPASHAEIKRGPEQPATRTAP